LLFFEECLMRRGIIQAIAVVAIGLGAGLFALGRNLDPRPNPAAPTAPNAMGQVFQYDKDLHISSSIATGFGVCLMTFGALSLAIPWVNDALSQRRGPGDAQAG
jgi:hypothetical protein